MSFETDWNAADSWIEREYPVLIVNSYCPLFDVVKEKAVEHMTAEGLESLDMGVHSGLVFRRDGHFYNSKGKIVELKELPKIYQDESNYIAGCADDRTRSTLSVHNAMRAALSNFREKVQQSLANSI